MQFNNYDDVFFTVTKGQHLFFVDSFSQIDFN
jgi:hypothetical protein